MRVPSINPRSARAQRDGRHAVECFFRSSPGRLHWRRPSIQFEDPSWGRDGHTAKPIVLVVRPNTRTLKHVTLAMSGDIAGVPDDEAFLALLWAHIQLRTATNGQPSTLISAQEHADLLRMTGHPVLEESVP